MKKRWIAMLLVGCMLLGLSGCGGKDEPEQPQEEPQQEEAPVEKKKKSYDPFDDILSIFREK